MTRCVHNRTVSPPPCRVLASQRLHRAGKIKSLYAELDWTQRLSAMRKDFPDAPVVLIKGGVLPAALQRLFADERMLDAAQQLGVGADVALNPAWNLRGKMPKHVRTLPRAGEGAHAESAGACALSCALSCASHRSRSRPRCAGGDGGAVAPGQQVRTMRNHCRPRPAQART